MESGLADDEGKRLAAQFAEMEPKLGRAVLAYLRLFSPAKRGLRTSRAIKLIEELMLLIKEGSVTRDARTSDRKPASAALWVSGIDQMLGQRDRLTLPLENHHYLRAVVFGIASDPQQARQAQLAAPSVVKQKGQTPQQIIQEQIGRIEGDVLLKIISKEEGERRLAALLGERA